MKFLLKGRKVDNSENPIFFILHMFGSLELSWLMECWKYNKKVKAQKDGCRLHLKPPFIISPVNTYCAFIFYIWKVSEQNRQRLKIFSLGISEE